MMKAGVVPVGKYLRGMMMGDKDLFVTRPCMPPLEEFIPYMERIWSSGVLTNGGEMHRQFEMELGGFLGVKQVSLFNNGTIALLTALQALRVTGEVITTPYSFVATAHSLLWNGIKPVFVDIDPDSLNIDPGLIEAAITPRTTAILGVHCYGNRCDVEAIQGIADAYNLRVIYDAAHAFGVNDSGGSILRHGDLSVLSFHATKVFNTFEGGAIVSPDEKTKTRIDRLKNFGFVDETTVVAPGINGKMSEFNAAFGLLQLKYIDGLIKKRKQIDAYYRERLGSVSGLRLLSVCEYSNYSYFPVLIGPDFPVSRDELYLRFRDRNVFARRYFYPLISSFPMYRGLESSSRSNLPVANSVAESVLCLPIYPDLSEADLERVIDVITDL